MRRAAIPALRPPSLLLSSLVSHALAPAPPHIATTLTSLRSGVAGRGRRRRDGQMP